MSVVRLSLGAAILAILAIQLPCTETFAQNPEPQYEVLSPWAEVDPVPVRGISSRIQSLAGRKIGLFVNYKRAATPIAAALEKKLKSMYPDAEISSFYSLEWNVTEVETSDRDKFTAWARGVDAVIMSVGD